MFPGEVEQLPPGELFKITWDSWRLVSTTDPGEMIEHHH
jgi:hypothetical protein